MEENFKNKLGLWMFIIIILGFAIGGYFFTQNIIKDYDSTKENKEAKKTDYKIDKDKDYIYFINEEVISEKAEIFYRDVVINLSTQETLTETLKKENRIYKNTIKYIKDTEVLEDIIVYNKDGLYALNFREYTVYEFEEYISLVVDDYNYTCFDDTTFAKTKSYIFNIKNGKLLTENEILKLYNKNMNKIKEQIKEYLNEEQTVFDNEELIKIDETINDFNNYSLYINYY